MAKRRVGSRRRSLIALLLVGFVLVTAGVITRRVYGVRQQSDIRKLRQRRDSLAAERVRLESVIRDGSSRVRLQPIAEQRLGMHIPTPEQQVFLPRAVRRAPSTRNDSL